MELILPSHCALAQLLSHSPAASERVGFPCAALTGLSLPFEGALSVGGHHPYETVRLERKTDCYWNIKEDREQMKFKYKLAAVLKLKNLN